MQPGAGAAHLPLLLLALATSLSAQTRDWRADDRVLISAFHEVGALASDARYLLAATRGGLVRYDLLQMRWETPLTEEDGYPVHEAPTALALDGLQSDLWLGTANGSLFRFRSNAPRWETAAFALGGAVIAIVPSRGTEDDGIWVQTRAGWLRASRFSLQTTPVPDAQVPPTVMQRALAQRTLDPSLAAFRASVGLDRQARRWPITAFARGDRPEQYWFGTNGAFLIQFDALRNQSEWWWYGAASRGVSALALLGDTLWLGADGRGARSGVVRVTADLQNWTLFDPIAGGPSGRIDQIVATDTALYFAGADGVLRMRRGNSRAERLSAERASSVAVAGANVWIGTRGGLLHVGPAGVRTMIGPPIQRLRTLPDGRLWLARADGLFHADAWAQPDSLTLIRESTLPSGTFLDVVQAGSRMIACTADALFIREASSWRGPVRVPALRGLGRLTTLAADGEAIWVGGTNGLARYEPAREEWLYFLTPRDLPAGPIDIVVQNTFVWLATPAGALRLAWR
jgi:ligand-binding sensor domain-containing protein